MSNQEVDRVHEGEIEPTTRQAWAEVIQAEVAGAVGSIIRAGELLNRAKAAIPHGEWGDFIRDDLGMSQRKVNRFQQIAEIFGGCDPALLLRLPPNYSHLAELAALPEEEREAAIAAGEINPDMKRSDVQKVKTKRQKNPPNPAPVEGLIQEEFGNLRNYGPFRVILFDFPGFMRLNDDEVPPGSFIEPLAADEAHIHIVTNDACLYDAMGALRHWGFEFAGTLALTRPNLDPGRFWRSSHTLVLTGTRGGLEPRNKSLSSVVETTKKDGPADLRAVIQRAATGPYLEINCASRFKPAEGWTGWRGGQ